MSKKIEFLKSLPSHYAEADPSPDICRFIINHLEATGLSFEEIYDDPRQLDFEAGVPALIYDKDIISFARQHAFDLQLLANELHYDRNVKLSIHTDPRDFAAYLVKIAIGHLRHELEVFKQNEKLEATK